VSRPKTRRRPLAALYAELNRTFFAGRLPRVRVRRVRDWRESGRSRPRNSRARLTAYVEALAREPLGTTWFRGAEPVEILVESSSSGLERETLLHEMIHVALGPAEAHGRRFVAELRRLAGLGESWASRAADLYANALEQPGIEHEGLGKEGA
jgi:hypothetical protein